MSREIMTDTALQEILARAEAATPGPWMAELLNREDGEWFVAMHTDRTSEDWRDSTLLEKPDAEFIAAARTEVPALVAEVRRLRAVMSGTAEYIRHELTIAADERNRKGGQHVRAPRMTHWNPSALSELERIARNLEREVTP